MRKFTSFGLALLLTFSLASAQNKQRTERLATPKQWEKVTYDARYDQMMRNQEALPTAKQIVRDNASVAPSSNGKTATVAPQLLGRSSNGFSILRPEQNQVWVDAASQTAVFIHRQDVTIWGGGSIENGKYRYDFSVDGGLNWTNDIGALQTAYTNYGRYPQMTGWNPNGGTNPYEIGLVWNGPNNKFPTPGWIGHNNGYTLLNSGTSTEHYLFDNEPTLLPGGLCQGEPGVFWYVDWMYDGTNILDSMYVMKGVYNTTTQDVDWAIHSTLYIPHDYAFDGAVHAVGPNISFSPDGQTGWIGFLGDLTEAAAPGGQDSAAFAPCFIKSSDGGNTWGAPVEMNLNNYSWIYDTLRTLWVDSAGNPASDGVATTAFDYDIVVDGQGNPHMSATVGSGGDGYAIAGTAKFLGHFYSEDGGATWDVDYMAPILTLRGEIGSPDPLTQDNNIQIGIDAAGDRVFFAWVDSDTTLIGFGETANLSPNLRITSKRLTDGYVSCYKHITDGDILWDGKAYFPALSPVVFTKGSGNNHHLPIVMMNLLTGDPAQSVEYYYFGGDAIIFESDYMDYNTFLTMASFDGGCAVVSREEVAPQTAIQLHQSFPNPNSGFATIRFELPAAQNVTMELVNMYGQEVGVLASGNFAAGEHSVEVNTADLAAGIYFYNLRAGEQVLTKKMIVTK